MVKTLSLTKVFKKNWRWTERSSFHCEPCKSCFEWQKATHEVAFLIKKVSLKKMSSKQIRNIQQSMNLFFKFIMRKFKPKNKVLLLSYGSLNTCLWLRKGGIEKLPGNTVFVHFVQISKKPITIFLNIFLSTDTTEKSFWSKWKL